LISSRPLTLGQEWTSADLAIAVAPNNAQHVLVAYGNAPGMMGSGQLQLIVAESTDSANRSALPAVSILPDGAIGSLYCQLHRDEQFQRHADTVPTQFLVVVSLASIVYYGGHWLALG
jgi:hypothetical protein